MEVTTFDQLRSVADVNARRIAITHPDQAARKAGMLAWHAGISRLQNPHKVLTPSWASWDYGWQNESEENS